MENNIFIKCTNFLISTFSWNVSTVTIVFKIISIFAIYFIACSWIAIKVIAITIIFLRDNILCTYQLNVLSFSQYLNNSDISVSTISEIIEEFFVNSYCSCNITTLFYCMFIKILWLNDTSVRCK